ncbi:MAG TPA: acyl-CoA dehydrogenase family protein [Mycobacteriales bacterium]|nr:acyl-CoA dehydrogenase family protein [Mycobacteriales bacterium]HWA65722.1 acyl-CoA dehydrogenase family protein [Mycobacteriales bacterium]
MSADDIEDVESFRERARTFIRANLAPLEADFSHSPLRAIGSDEAERDGFARDREIQRLLWDNSLAGICFPKEYGGLGLTPAHQKAFNAEIAGFEYPSRLQAPTFAPCAAVLLDFGTEEQKQRHIPAILKGEEIWMQLLSEPSGGSDVAGALTSAVREGDDWILNGSKVWTTGAWWSDWGLVLARTNWDVPKHRGLTVFMMPIRAEGVAVHRIEMLNGSKEFCQEFLTDVRVPDSDRIGEVDGGWTVGTRWMYHERMLLNSPLVTVQGSGGHSDVGAAAVAQVAQDVGRADDPDAQRIVGEVRMLELVKFELVARVGEAMRTGALNDQSAAIGRLFGGVTTSRSYTLAFDLAGPVGAAWSETDGEVRHTGTDFLMRQSSSIGGGTLEMARNVISERVLGMPRERSVDKDIPFREVPRGAPAQR